MPAQSRGSTGRSATVSLVSGHPEGAMTYAEQGAAPAVSWPAGIMAARVSTPSLAASLGRWHIARHDDADRVARLDAAEAS